MKVALRLENVCKKSEGHNLFNINFTVQNSDIMGILTRDDYYAQSLLSLLTGQALPDSGRIYLDEEPVLLKSEVDAQHHGIYCVRSQTQLVQNLSVAENIYSVTPMNLKHFIIHPRRMYRAAKDLFLKYGLIQVRVSKRPYFLTPAQQHLIEVVKCVAAGARIIVLDNMFHQYSDADFEQLFALLRQLAAEGITILMLANAWNPHLAEDFTRLSILRSGTITAQMNRGGFDPAKISVMLSGGELPQKAKTAVFDASEVVLQVDRLYSDEGLNQVSFSLAAGEVLGILDADGYSADNLMMVLNNNANATGQVYVQDKLYQLEQSRFDSKGRVGYVPVRDCAAMILPHLSLYDNITLLVPSTFCRTLGSLKNRVCNYLFKSALESIHSEELIEQRNSHSFEGMSRETLLKIVCARYICAGARVIAFASPQYLFDESNIQNFKQLLDDLRAAQIAVMVASPNIPVLGELCTRTLRMEKGRISSENPLPQNHPGMA